jgi:hypothetical protein
MFAFAIDAVDFARIGAFGKRALEFEWLADNEAVSSVRLHCRSIARHYHELAESEEQADQARVAECLERLRLQRQQAAGAKATLPARSGVSLAQMKTWSWELASVAEPANGFHITGTVIC